MADEPLPPVIASLRAALSAAPEDLALRLLLAEQLLAFGRPGEAASECAQVLRQSPGHPEALALLTRATDTLREPASDVAAFDWSGAERQLIADGGVEEAVPTAPESTIGGMVDSDLRLGDVGGMADVKKRLRLALFNPMQNPDLHALYGKSLNGGLLLYGPPGCGKTFLARAVAGELGARFYAVTLADVLDAFIGASERNMHEIFETARANTPCVLFLDELDALGQKRTHLRGASWLRGTVNQLLVEMDSVASNNDGLFVLGATNHPWDVDSALLRPGRLDRLVFVSPPDLEARESILNFHLSKRPLEGVNVEKIAGMTEGYSGADLAHVCDTATEAVLDQAIQSGEPRPIKTSDLIEAARSVRPSVGSWLEDARNVALFGNGDGRYDELVTYLRKRKLA